MAKLSIHDLMNTPASQLTTLIPKGKYQAVCTEVFFHLNEQDILIDLKPTGEKEIVTQMVCSFELVMPDGAIKTIDSSSLTVLYASGNPVNIASDKSNIGKFLGGWSGNKRGTELTAWLGSYGSLKGRNVILTIDHKESKAKSIYAFIASVQELVELPGQKVNFIEASNNYIPFLERNKSNFVKTEDGWMRVFTPKEDETTVAATPTPNEVQAAINLQKPTKGKSKDSTYKPPSDEDIPF